MTAFAYAPAWHGGELWDDDGHLTRADLQSTAGLTRIWTDIGATQQYYPLVHTAFWVMNRLWGADPFGYHFVNIVLHATAAWLVFVLLRRINLPGAIPAAVVFALHPVHVESVAWMTELKNTLSGVFALGAALAYLRFDTTRDRRPYVVAVALFALALLSKSVVATLPVVLVVIFWWQRGRVDLRRDVAPLLPLVAMAASAGAMTAWFEQALIGAKGDEFALTFVERTLIAGRALAFYAGKLMWPADLTFIYPRWNVSQAVWWQYLFPIAVLAVAAACWRWRHRHRGPFAALAIFAVVLGPALGFVNVYPFRYSFVADHFQYLASIAIIALVIAALHRVVAARAGSASRADVVLAIALGLPLFALTWTQAHDYVSAETLYRATLARNPACWMALHNLAILRLRGSAADAREAAALTERALALNPRNAEAHNTMALALQELGRIDEALPHLREAMRLNPTFAAAHNNLAAAAHRLGRIDEAEQGYREAIRLDPNYAEAHRNLGLIWIARGRFDDAVSEIATSLQLNPSSTEAPRDLAQAYFGQGAVALRSGRRDEAISRLRDGLRLDEASAIGHYHLAEALASANQLPEAITHYRRSIALQPDARSAIVHNDLGVALALSGNLAAAAVEFREALRLDPNLVDAKNNLARANRSR